MCVLVSPSIFSPWHAMDGEPGLTFKFLDDTWCLYKIPKLDINDDIADWSWCPEDVQYQDLRISPPSQSSQCYQPPTALAVVHTTAVATLDTTKWPQKYCQYNTWHKQLYFGNFWCDLCFIIEGVFYFQIFSHNVLGGSFLCGQRVSFKDDFEQFLNVFLLQRGS